MFDSRSKAVKVIGYIIIGFFTIIIIISFGMPDFLSRLGMNQNVVATVNGEEISYLDFLHYRDNFARYMKNANDKDMQKYILDALIRYRLQLQMADEMGIKVSEENVKSSIKKMQIFKDKSGNFNNEYFQNYLNYFHYSLSDFMLMVKEDLINIKMMNMINMGIGITEDEVNTQHIIDNSKIQIKYCFASNKELKKRFGNKIKVSENEIDEELKKNRKEVKDPKTDRNRLKNKLVNKKFESVKRELTREINELAKNDKSFNMAAKKLGGKIFYSNQFKIGSPIKGSGKKGKTIHSINNSTIFRNDCLALGVGKTSRVISSFEGLYVFTPVKKDIGFTKPSSSKFTSIHQKLIRERERAMLISMISSYKEKSKITKNMKFD
ncbi:MAG: SurA N-terminal domain-containing protein [Spirochaetota bacterium]|nr:SurA N-terminal domain-containing protein [Spirochaetota bacterium]